MSWPDDSIEEIRYDVGDIADTYDNWALGLNERGDKGLKRIANLVTKLGKIERDSLFLSIAGGTGYIEQFIPCDNLILLDISIKMLNVAKKKRVDKLIKGDLFQLPFRDETFDCVYLKSAMFHLGEEIRLEVVREMKRVSRSGGRIIVVFPNILWLRIAGFIKHLNPFYDDFGTTVGNIRKAFEKNSLCIENIFLINSLPYISRHKIGKMIEKISSRIHFYFYGFTIICQGVKG